MLLDELERFYLEVSTHDNVEEGFFIVVLAILVDDTVTLHDDNLLRLQVFHLHVANQRV